MSERELTLTLVYLADCGRAAADAPDRLLALLDASLREQWASHLKHARDVDRFERASRLAELRVSSARQWKGSWLMAHLPPAARALLLAQEGKNA